MGKEKTNDQGRGQSQRRRRMGWGGGRVKGQKEKMSWKRGGKMRVQKLDS